MPLIGTAAFASNLIKKTCLLLLLLFAITPSITKAQNTGSLVGIGMGACNTYTFYSTTTNSVITPLNYGNQYFACTGQNDDDISFNPQGNGWRVQIKSWYFSVIGSTTASLTGFDPSNSPISAVTISGTDVLATTNYTFIAGPIYICDFIKNNVFVGTYRRNSWTITAP